MKQQSGFKKFLIFSLAIHLGFFIISVAKVTFLPKKTITIEPTMRVDIVALPDKIDKIAPAPKKAEEKTIKKLAKIPKKKPAKKPKKKLAKKPKEKLADKPKEEKSEPEATSKETAPEETSEPVPVIKGNVLSKGTQLEGLVKLDFDDYFDLIASTVNSNWSTPEWLSEEQLRATAIIKLNPDGSIASRAIKESSGNDVFDNSILKAFDTIGRLPEPPERIKSLINAYGISFGFPE